MTIKKRSLVLGVLMFGILMASFAILQNHFVLAQSSTVCAVYSSQGTCQDVDPSQVSANSPTYQTSCVNGPGECILGTCVTPDGTCSSSPRAACDAGLGGTFYSTSPSNTPVCNQGCCIVGNQGGSVTTQANCNSLKGLYPTATISFRSDVTDSLTCSALAAPTAQGACVLSTSAGKTCVFTTQGDCLNKTNDATAFHLDWLCTNQNLQNEGVNCTKTARTNCFSGQPSSQVLPMGQDPVYFIDSCGNPANVYDYNQMNNASYWNYIAGTNGVSLEGTAASGNFNINGNCNYYSGSTCAQYDRNIDPSPSSDSSSSYICRSLNCNQGQFVQEFKSAYGRTPVNGETWCARTDPANQNSIILGNNTGLTSNSGGTPTVVSDLAKNETLPGSSDYLLGCYSGKVTVELCDNTRNKICQQDQNSNGVYQSSCTLNNWMNCYAQNTSTACESAGDCQWIVGATNAYYYNNGSAYVYDKSSKGLVVPNPPTQDLLSPISGKVNVDSRPGAACVPKYAPGFDVSATSTQNSKTAAVSWCNIGSTTCLVNYTRGAVSSLVNADNWYVSANIISCLNDAGQLVPGWATNFSNLCFSLGDCGVSPNYINAEGSNTQSSMFQIIGNLSNETG